MWALTHPWNKAGNRSTDPLMSEINLPKDQSLVQNIDEEPKKRREEEMEGGWWRCKEKGEWEGEKGCKYRRSLSKELRVGGLSRRNHADPDLTVFLSTKASAPWYSCTNRSFLVCSRSAKLWRGKGRRGGVSNINIQPHPPPPGSFFSLFTHNWWPCSSCPCSISSWISLTRLGTLKMLLMCVLVVLSYTKNDEIITDWRIFFTLREENESINFKSQDQTCLTHHPK